MAEADAERPGEGKFSAKLLQPDVVVWLSLEEAHGINYDRLVRDENKKQDIRGAVREAIAEEFGHFIENTKKFAVLNGDNRYIEKQAKRGKAEISLVSPKDISSFSVERDGVRMITTAGVVHLPHLVPADVGLSTLAVMHTLLHLRLPFDSTFKSLVLPPGRSSVLEGKRNTTIIDSSYNATFDGMRAMLDLISKYPASGEKWLVLGDMIEQGKSESSQHTDVSGLILEVKPARVILVGPRLKKHTYPILVKALGEKSVVSYLMPADALQYLENELRGGEVILFKGARYLEGVVEKLLKNPEDASRLCRREAIFDRRRKQWGI